MKLYSIGVMNSDCTIPYKVDFTEKENTVETFINSVIKNKTDWGFIKVHTTYKTHFKIEYSYGVIKTHFSNNLMSSIIDVAYANGGYSRMDYELFLKE